jgi:4-hydroxy-3-polyprenylbenzoate decarboxylase
MAYSGLGDFINDLQKNNELLRIREFVNPVLEIAEITDRVTKSGGKALLFENTGTAFPVLINAFGSDKRMALALGLKDLDNAGSEIKALSAVITGNRENFPGRLSALPSLIKLAGYLPSRVRGRGSCQQVIIRNPDLGILPVLKCWPLDGGRFITLPMVHTIHPVTAKANVGMYRMQILDKETTGMHWQRHKTGAAHFEAWKRSGSRMPVSVALGGDPVYAYSATAPLPEGVNEYILAGFLRKKRVRMVRCITNGLYVPSDADIILEGYVDPSEEPVTEGPFGDHTGFYSLADTYPKFHVTCITHRKDAVYPATVVGVPPHEDAWLAKATERIFLTPVKMTMLPEIEDFHMPSAGIAHNLVIVKIKKSFPGQGMKVINSLSGTGQMMFAKYLVVVSGDVDIRNYRELSVHLFENVDPGKDLMFFSGPLDVLDHSSDAFSFGGKMGVDATIKHPEENGGRQISKTADTGHLLKTFESLSGNPVIEKLNADLFSEGIPVLIISVDRSRDEEVVDKVRDLLLKNDPEGLCRLILVADRAVDPFNLPVVAWQILGNTDPRRDHKFITSSSVLIDGTIKAFRKGGFPRGWPNVVCSDEVTISKVDKMWDSLGLGPYVPSPSKIYGKLRLKGDDKIITGNS